ncbi:MAG: YggT family protein [Alphaproteobacteria bacterium]|nr:YggT family protein [Alphaproteobacteria bacterium]
MAILTSLFFAFVVIINLVLELYKWLLIIGAVLSWLVAFEVVNTRNRFVHSVGDFCFRLTEPLLRRIRRWIPSINGLDLSPIVLIFAIIFLQSFLSHLTLS